MFKSLKYLLVLSFPCNIAIAQKKVDTTEIITIGGIKQYVLIKGNDRTNPLLLFLHGGPGGSLMQQADKITGKLMEQFTVVHWDQRETGKTLQLNKSAQPLTLQMFYNDTHDLVDTLLQQFQKQKLYLVGYSWGTVPGFYMAENFPQLLHAYIAVSPVINEHESDSISLAMLKVTMGKKARQELASVKIPFENWEQLYYHRKWLLAHDGQKFVNLALPKSFVQRWATTWFDLWAQATLINRFENMKPVNVPVYFFAGADDYNTNVSITKEYFKRLSAPKKDLFVFPNTAHSLPETDPGQFQLIIIDKIRPQTINE